MAQSGQKANERNEARFFASAEVDAIIRNANGLKDERMLSIAFELGPRPMELLLYEPWKMQNDFGNFNWAGVVSSAVWILLVFYKSGLPMEEVLELIKKRADSYRHVRGLLQKLWIHDESSGHVGGIYIFDSKDSLEAFQNSSLAKGIGKAYKVEGLPTRRVLKVTNVLFQGKKRLV